MYSREQVKNIYHKGKRKKMAAQLTASEKKVMSELVKYKTDIKHFLSWAQKSIIEYNSYKKNY